MCFWTAATINFNQSTYTVNESSGYVYPVLVLSKPFTSYYRNRVTVVASSATAYGECIAIKIINHVYFNCNWIYGVQWESWATLMFCKSGCIKILI